MNQENPESNKEASTNFSIKRKRGRPRKPLNHRENDVLRFQNINHRGNAHAPPGFQGVNGNHVHLAHPINGDAVVGQAVHGVIEAVFDAGYLLNVRVGNSATTLRGIVLKPGHYVPVSAYNDVAPDVRMIRRNEIPIPSEDYSQVPVYNAQSRERSERNVSLYRNGTASLRASKGKERPSISTHTADPLFSRNIYQPVNLSNGQAASVPRKAILPEASEASDGSKAANPALTVGNLVPPLHAQISHQPMQNQPPAEVLQAAEAKSVELPSMPFEKLLTEVLKRVQAPTQSGETQNGNNNDDATNTEEALSIEPLQAIQPNVNGLSTSLPKPFENFRTGKMTELLRAVQEKTMENQAQPHF